MIRVAAVILAGGKGERLGGAIKANVEVGGVRLLERVSRALGPLPRPVIVAHGSIPPEALKPLPGQVALADLDADYAGPLAGLAAAVAHSAELPSPPDALVTIAVDTPFVPHDYVERLVAALGNRPAAMARCEGQNYPTSTIWRLSAIAALPDEVRAGTAPRSLRRLAEEIGAVTIDWPEGDAGDPFANVNTPENLAAMEARAAAR